LRFGVWGYRDCVEDIPDIEYTTRNFTPELKPIKEFLLAMEGIEETKVDSVDFPRMCSPTSMTLFIKPPGVRIP